MNDIATDLKQYIGDKSTIYNGLGSQNIEIYHTIPYLMGTWTDGKHEEIFYVSKSHNNGFKNVDGSNMKMDQVRYKNFTDMFMEICSIEGYQRAFNYLLNIQKVCNRTIDDCKKLLDSKIATTVQFKYIKKNLEKVIRKSQQVLHEQKKMLKAEENDVSMLYVSTTQKSIYSQTMRVARAIRILKTIDVL
jgi:hypothetical protein